MDSSLTLLRKVPVKVLTLTPIVFLIVKMSQDSYGLIHMSPTKKMYIYNYLN